MFMSFWMFRRNNSMNPALLVWLVGIPLAACEIYPSIQWIPENPIFLQKDYLMNVKSMSRLNIVCPNPVSILTTVKHNTPKELLFENLWVVTAEGFKACDATLPGSKLLLQCDTPLELKYYTVVFQQYSASATGLEFQTGKEYYFIATSDGTKASLLNKRGGHCDNGLMKLKVYVCHNGHDERCTPRPTTATIPSTSNSKISTEGEQKTTQSENSDNGNGPDNELYVGRQTGENGVSSHAKSEEIRVKCASSMMQVRIKKNLIEEFELRDLQLEDGDACSAGRWESETYFYLEVPFLGCGTKLKENNASLVYNNIVKDRQSKIPHINRLPQLEIPFSCVYKKRGTVSLVSVDVRRPRVMQIIPDDGVGGFTLEMSLYTSEDYLERRRHFPLSVTINEQLYFQVAVDTPDQRLSIIADTCYATPTSNGSVDSRHYIIRNRCPSDKTLQTYPAPAGKDRFSFRAFQFVHSKEKPYIYVHCKVLVCNASDQASSCIRGCGIVPMLKRQRRDTTSVGYSLNEGPIQIVDIDGKILKSGQSMQEEESAINFTEAAFLTVMAIICTLLICGVIYTRQQLTRAQREQNDRTPVPVQL